MALFGRFRDRSRDPGDVASPVPPAPAVAPAPPLPAASPLPPVPEADPTTREEQLEWLEESARELTAAAFVSRTDAEQSLVEQYVLDDECDLTEDDVRAVLQRVWQERLDEQDSWPDEGGYTRLRAAFAALDADGVVARMNFACCQTCGHAEIEDERSETSRGYVFFHQQDAERLAPGDSDLFLAFGSFGSAEELDASLVERARVGDEEARRQAMVASEERIGAEVSDALRRHGLTVDWDGTAAQRIQVTGLDWRKRLPVD